VVGSGNSVERAFALREAAISAAKCGEWKQARVWFLEAQGSAAASQTDDMQVMAAELVADAAVAAMETSNIAEALTEFASSVTGLRQIDPEASLQAAYCHRVVRHAPLRGWILTRSATLGALGLTKERSDFPLPRRRLPLHFEDAKAAPRKGKSSRLKALRCCTSRRNSGLPRHIDIDKVSDEEIQDIVLTANLKTYARREFFSP
jgi:hypothetical protein